jgi:hypothetical protein
MKLYYSLLGMNKADCFEILSTGNEVSKATPNQLGKPLLFFHSFSLPVKQPLLSPTHTPHNEPVQTILLSFDAQTVSLAAYPTKFGQELTVALTTPAAATATLRLVDALGREVWHQEQTVTPGAAPLHIQPACAAGTYILTATVAGQVLHQRVVKD